MYTLIYSDKNKKAYIKYTDKIVAVIDCKSKKQSQYLYCLLVAPLNK